MIFLKFENFFINSKCYLTLFFFFIKKNILYNNFTNFVIFIIPEIHRIYSISESCLNHRNCQIRSRNFKINPISVFSLKFRIFIITFFKFFSKKVIVYISVRIFLIPLFLEIGISISCFNIYYCCKSCIYSKSKEAPFFKIIFYSFITYHCFSVYDSFFIIKFYPRQSISVMIFFYFGN